MQLSRRLSATLGVDFFQSLVKNLSEALTVDCVYVGELTGTPRDRLRTLAVIRDGLQSPGFERKISGTACGQVLLDGVFACSKEVRRLFPDDTHLQEVAAEGYAGIRLCDTSGQSLGVLAMASKAPMLDASLAKSVLEAFAPRVAAEMERKRDDDLRRESEERYHAFIASNPDAMWRVEFDPAVALDQPEDEVIEQLYRFGYLAECNDAVARANGRQRADELLGLPFENFAPRTDAELQQELRAAVRSQFQAAIVERVVTDENGRQTYRLRSQFGIVENGRLRRIWGNTRDITDLRQAELAAATSERRFREMLEGIELPTVMLDEQGKITFCNEAFVRLTQHSRAELADLTWLDGVVSATELDTWKGAISADLTQKGRTIHFEGEINAKDGSQRLVQWDAICRRNREGRPGALAAFGRDMTYQRALESQIRRAETLEGIGRLAAGVAHDFNNLLMIVLGHVSQLIEQVGESDPWYPSLQAIFRAATQSAQLTERLLALGRRQLIRPQLIDLNTVIDEGEGLLRTMAGASVALRIERSRHLPLVLAEPIQMQEVLANLVCNARDAMPHGGNLTVATDCLQLDDEDPGYPGIGSGTYVRLSVIDSGTGLPAEIQSHIFEPFFTTKAPGKGSGLGLSTVYAIVKQCGGHITVRSVRNAGTTFEILLPAPVPAER